MRDASHHIDPCVQRTDHRRLGSHLSFAMPPVRSSPNLYTPDPLHARRTLAAPPPAVADPALVAGPRRIGEPQFDRFPTSPDGLPVGTVYRNGTSLMIV